MQSYIQLDEDLYTLRLTVRGKEQQERQTKVIKSYINQLRTKVTTAQTEKQS